MLNGSAALPTGIIVLKASASVDIVALSITSLKGVPNNVSLSAISHEKIGTPAQL